MVKKNHEGFKELQTVSHCNRASNFEALMYLYQSRLAGSMRQIPCTTDNFIAWQLIPSLATPGNVSWISLVIQPTGCQNNTKYLCIQQNLKHR